MIKETQRLGEEDLHQAREMQAVRLAILDREIAARKFADADSVLKGYTKRVWVLWLGIWGGVCYDLVSLMIMGILGCGWC